MNEVTLKQMCVVNISSLLWKRESTLNIFQLFLINVEDWIELTKTVVNNVNHLNVPECVRTYLKHAVVEMGVKMRFWFVWCNQAFRIDISNEDIYWTNRGRIDEEKTAKNYILKSNFSVEQKFKIATFFCLVDSINELWEHFPKGLTIDCHYYLNKFGQYWVACLLDDFREFDERHETSTSLERTKLMWNVSFTKSNTLGALYFMSLLDPTQKISFLSPDLHKAHMIMGEEHCNSDTALYFFWNVFNINEKSGVNASFRKEMFFQMIMVWPWNEHCLDYLKENAIKELDINDFNDFHIFLVHKFYMNMQCENLFGAKVFKNIYNELQKIFQQRFDKETEQLHGPFLKSIEQHSAIYAARIAESLAENDLCDW